MNFSSSLRTPPAQLRRLLPAALALILVLGCPAAPAQNSPKPNPQMQAVLDELAALKPKPLASLTPAEARKQPGPADAVKSLQEKQQLKGPEAVGYVTNKGFKQGRSDVNVRIYAPKGDGPFPVILYIHGGGWVIGDLDTYDASARALCNSVRAVVVATHYRQAPEHKFPAAHADVLAAYQWVLKNIGKFNGDPYRVAVVGESAGGNMACALSLMARNRRLPLPLHQVLIYPVTDATTLDTASYVENEDAKPLNKAAMQWFFSQMLANPAHAKDPRLSIALAGDALKGLPPTTIITAQLDPLRSDGEKLAAALQSAGVAVKLKNYEGVTHEFFGMGAVLDEARKCMAFVAAELKPAFAKQPAPTALQQLGAAAAKKP